MKSTFVPQALLALCCSAAASSMPSNIANEQRLPDEGAPLFRNAPPTVPADHRIPTSYESAVMARRILALTPHGTLVSSFPHDDNSNHGSIEGEPVYASENRPPGLGGVPIGLVEYIADCEDSGNPTLLEVMIATPFRNYRAGSNLTLSVQWVPPYKPSKRISLVSTAMTYLGLGSAGSEEPRYPVQYSAANQPRFSLVGHLEEIPGYPWEGQADSAKECFLKAHPDARLWLPGSGVHRTKFMRFVVSQVYWLGGFGDRAYIGWISLDEWHNATRKEWERIRLPGEKKGWDEWSTSGWAQTDL